MAAIALPVISRGKAQELPKSKATILEITVKNYDIIISTLMAVLPDEEGAGFCNCPCFETVGSQYRACGVERAFRTNA